jgi:diguanylate cyclase (GGDEF)-like protein
MNSPTDVLVIPGLMLVALIGAAAYEYALVRRRTRRIVAQLNRFAEGLESHVDGPITFAVTGMDDPDLHRAFARLCAGLTATHTQATTDLLTGCPNRQAALARLDDELARSERYGRPLAVGLIDLDHFKQVNDVYGHAVGDIVLNHVATLLRREIRAVDVLGRYGGEEFVLILPETSVDDAGVVAEKLRRAVAAVPVARDEGDAMSITVSIGVAGSSSASMTLDRLIRDADAALYAAKSLGRDQVYLFREKDPDRLIARKPVTPAARAAALDVGRQALAAANDALADRLRDRPAWAGGASAVIAEIATQLARAVGLSPAEVDRIRTASLLHDLGKLAIPDEILHKPAGLDDAEWRTVTEHPRIGQLVLEQAGALRDAAEIVLHHHEWFDGRGYPYGLAGDDIPIGARIVTIADAYEAMIGGRPYQGAMSHVAALQELSSCAGSQFDPTLVDIFVALYRDHAPAVQPAYADGEADGGVRAEALAPAAAADGSGDQAAASAAATADPHRHATAHVAAAQRAATSRIRSGAAGPRAAGPRAAGPRAAGPRAAAVADAPVREDRTGTDG